MRSFKAAIFDLDGTLTNAKKEITPRTRAAIMALQERGVKIILASGRPTFGIVPLAEQLELKRFGGYILAFNGGVINDCRSGEDIFSITLPQHLLKGLYEECSAAGFATLSYEGSDVLCEDVEDQYVKYEAMLNRMGLRKIPSFLEHFTHPIPKALTVGDPSRSEALVEHLNGLYGAEMSIYRSEPFFVELLPLGIDKARSLERLCEMTGLRREEMISFGDGFNDLSMIEWAGCGVAMLNGQESVRASADVVTRLSNEEDGVADFIEREML